LHGGDDEDDSDTFLVTVTFEEQGEKTKLITRTIFNSVAACEKVEAFRAIEGNNKTLNRLEEHLAPRQGLSR